MERVKHHYCWVKAVRSGEAAALESATPDAQPVSVGFSTLNWSTARSVILSPHVPVPASQKQRRTGIAPESPGVPVPASADKAADQNADSSDSLRGNDMSAHDPKSPAAEALTSRAVDARTAVPASVAQGPAGPVGAVAQPLTPPPAPQVELMFAGATFMGAWQFERMTLPVPQREGDEGVAFAWQPIVGTREEALAWPTTGAGAAWCGDAIALLLVGFVAVGDL